MKKKYEVCIDYIATKVFEVEADTPEEAEAKGLRLAGEVAPYDELSLTVGYVDEVEE